MTSDQEGRALRGVSRRNLLKQVGLGGAAATLTAAPVVESAVAQPSVTVPTPRREALETLTGAEADILEAVVARLIPSDANGPGATEARAAHYIDRALVGALRSSRADYAAGLEALDAYAQSKKGLAFIRLSAADQDALLTDMEKNVATGFTPNASTFFNLVRTHTIQGTYCDPYYGGNADFVGWDMIGYPGLRLAAGADDQRMGAPSTPVRQSAYDDLTFTMKGGNHGHRP
jgi:gluconate 2-dehydrogenase gamma chain